MLLGVGADRAGRRSRERVGWFRARATCAAGRLPAIAGELRMIRAAMHLACAEAAGVGAEADQSTAQKFLKQVAPQLLTDLAGIVSHPDFVRG